MTTIEALLILLFAVVMWVLLLWGTWQSSEVLRLKRGEFTPEELQNLCHNLTSTDYRQFCDGCTNFQRKLFNGRSREDDLREVKNAGEHVHVFATCEPGDKCFRCRKTIEDVRMELNENA